MQLSCLCAPCFLSPFSRSFQWITNGWFNVYGRNRPFTQTKEKRGENKVWLCATKTNEWTTKQNGSNHHLRLSANFNFQTSSSVLNLNKWLNQPLYFAVTEVNWKLRTQCWPMRKERKEEKKNRCRVNHNWKYRTWRTSRLFFVWFVVFLFPKNRSTSVQMDEKRQEYIAILFLIAKST